MNIISKRFIFLGFSGALIALSLIFVVVFGLKQGIDLKGGTSWQLGFEKSDMDENSLKLALSEEALTSEIQVKKSGDGSFIVRLPDISEEDHQKYLEALKNKFGNLEEKNFSSIGPAIGEELRQKSIWAIIVVILAISAYIAWAFRKVSEPVKSWKYGIVTLITLLHDVIIPAGLLAVLGKLKGIEIDTNFIVALLVVMGFSVHDTIVVFDRIRENLILNRGRNTPLESIINYSIKETIVRSINTSLTLVIVLITILFVGPPSLFYFILTILVGTVFGTYSSIFVASPLLYIWQSRRGRG